jgi:hypothetical protein
MKELSLIIRTCDQVTAFSGGRPRDFGSKSEIMKKCLTSVRNSVNRFIESGNEISLTIVDDHSSEEMTRLIDTIFPGKILKLKNSGNGASFGKCVDIAKQMDGLVFLLEDDYLLKEECIESLVNSYHKIKSELNIEPCFHPSDYPDRYKLLYPSLIALGSDRHYRTIKHTTCTFMYDASIFREFENELKVFCDYGLKPGITEDNSINLVYNKYYCFSPIPSLAEHYQYTETLSPFFSNTL